MRPTSIKQVAERAGVSVGTVSNVLNRPEVVTEDTRSRVVRAITDLGFVRNEAARSLRSGRGRTVGLVVLDVANPFFTDVGRGAEAVVEAHGSVLTLCNTGGDPQRQTRHLEHLEQQRAQGVLITPVDGDDARLDELVARGVPVVLLDSTSERGAAASRAGDGRCSVSVDDVLGGRLAAQHLLDQGHRRIAFVGGPPGVRQVAERRQGVEAVLGADPDLPALHVVETPALSVGAGRQAGDELASLPAARRPTGVFCANDLLALGVLQALTTAGVRVPAEVALVGYDDIEYAAAAAVPLSSVRQPREELGRTAADLLFDEIAGGGSHRHRHVVFDPDLVVRTSSRARRGRSSRARRG